LGIRADAHRRKLVLPIDHVVQSVREPRRAHPIEDDMRNRIHRFVSVFSGFFPNAQDRVLQVVLIKPF
jgi:hypothetical protein